MLLVELGKLFERVVAGDVGIEDEKRRVIFAENFLCELEGSSSTERFGFDRDLDFDLVLFFELERLNLNLYGR